MSLRIQPRIFSMIASADMVTSQGCFVTLYTADPTKCQLSSTSTDIKLGTLANNPASGEVALIYGLGGGGFAQASTSISAGAMLTGTTSGQAVTTATSKDQIGAIALEAATEQNDLIEVLIVMFEYETA